MKKVVVLALLLFITGGTHILLAQDKKPKVALVLSGGGAKGIAHIPLLQALDSLGIVPDIVIGTSMGSVVGGFYSVGYSGDSISQIAHSADWSELLGGDISLEDVSMEEKSEFRRHLVDFDIIKGKPKVNSGLLKDQKLREFISSYTYLAYNIQNFDKLPIPFRAMTTDIVNGKEVLLSEGTIGMAMRASMSIPGVFEPIEYNNTLLVDGGVLNNFPVDIAKEMGYDIIIGSDVGGGMQKKDKLNSIPSLLFQTGMLASNLKNPKNRELCDILIDHVPNLTYSTGEFTKAPEIFLEGEKAVAENMGALVSLAEQLKKFKQRKHQIPELKDEFTLDTIIYHGVSDANLELVRARDKLESHQKYSSQELVRAVDRAMGTNLFNQITYYPGFEGGKLQLHLDGDERSQNVIKGSLHYESYRGAGVMMNYTGRNILGKASRLLVTADIAVQPRFRVQYQKLFGSDKSWWWRSEVLAEFLQQKFYFSGEVAENLKSAYYLFDNQFNKNINSLHSYAGIGISADKTFIKPKLNPDINESFLGLERYSFMNLEIDVHYQYNNLNKVFYPTRGMFFSAGVARSILHDVEVLWSDDREDINGQTKGATKLKLNMEKRWSLNEKVTGILGVNIDYIFEDSLGEDELSFTYYGYGGLYSLGGIIIQPRKDSFTFAGLHDDELTVSQVMSLKTAVQLNPFSKFFFTPHVNLATVGFGDFNDYIENAFSPVGKWSEALETSFIFSSGINVGYHSFLGPINFDISYVNDIEKVRVFFSLGLLFNRSN